MPPALALAVGMVELQVDVLLLLFLQTAEKDPVKLRQEEH